MSRLVLPHSAKPGIAGGRLAANSGPPTEPGGSLGPARQSQRAKPPLLPGILFTMIGARLLADFGQRAVTGLGLPDRMLDAEPLIRRSRAAAALTEHGADDPLRLLLTDYRRTGLSFIGCFAARFDMQRRLGNLSALAARATANPAILQAPLTAPIFITGLPRSGTTFLFKLLAEDPENRSPAVWETVYPLPRKPSDTVAARIAGMQRQLDAFDRMAPQFQAIHPIEATSPQECTEISAHVFRSFRFETTHDIPAYRAWLHAADHLPAYRFHRQFLQHLQQNDGRPRRWVLKCPDHVFALAALKQAYPDARLIFLHRDPLDVLASVAGMTEILRRPFNAAVDRAAIGRQVSEDWAAGTQAMLDADAKGLFAPEQVLHLRFRELTAKPLDAIEAIYSHFGLPLPPEVRQRMAQHVADRPRGGYGGLTFALADYGIDPTVLRPRFAAYQARFRV